jgi:hypothetical protein
MGIITSHIGKKRKRVCPQRRIAEQIYPQHFWLSHAVQVRIIVQMKVG